MKTNLIIVTLVILTSLASISSRGAEMADPKFESFGPEIEISKARQVAKTLNPEQKLKLLTLLNKGAEKDLSAIKGIASGRAKMVIKERPFSKVEDVIKVKGIGLSTFAKIVDFGKNPPVPKKAF